MAKQNDKDDRSTDEFRLITQHDIRPLAAAHDLIPNPTAPDTNELSEVSEVSEVSETNSHAHQESLLLTLSDPSPTQESADTHTPNLLQAVQQASQQRNILSRALINRARDLIQVLEVTPDGQFRFTFVSDGLHFVLGFTSDEFTQYNDVDYVHTDDLTYTHAVLQRCYQNPDIPVLLEYRARHKDGTWRHLESHVVNCLKDNAIQGFVMTTRDVTESREREAHLLSRIAWFAALSSQTTDALRVVHADGSVQVASGRLSWLFGESSNGMNPEALLQRTHPDDLKQVQEGIAHALESPNARVRLGFRARDPQEEWRYVELEMLNCLEDTLIQGVILTGRDLTARKLFDSTTRLPNRTLFLDRVERLLQRRQHTPDEEFAVLVAEVDRYKEVNDGLGSAVGERLLKTISSRLVVSVRPADFVGRLDRDKFTLLLHGLRAPADVARICQRIHETIEQPCFLGGHRVFTTITLGVALSTSDFHSAADMLHAAEAAMHRGKHRGGSTTEMFDPTMGEEVRLRLQIEGSMRHAIERKEFQLHYQPIVSLNNYKLAGFEALCRWTRPDGSSISPGIFIPIAEDTGMINPLGEWILSHACQRARIWERNARQPLFLTVNLSGKQLARTNIVDEVRRILDQTQITPQRLKLEVTETSLITNADEVAKTLHALRKLGVRLALDDFGTGYSSLSYLHRFPFNTIKIDMSFVAMLGQDNEGAAIVPTIIQLAQTLGMDVVAEGIETPQQAKLLKEMGCTFGQGFLFSRGLPEDQLDPILKRDSLHP